jgi:broad specificity phosphatase PhoE
MRKLGRAFNWFAEDTNLDEQRDEDLNMVEQFAVHVGTLRRQQQSLQNFFEYNTWAKQQDSSLLTDLITSHKVWNEFEFQKILKHYQKHLHAEPQTRSAITRGGIHAFHYLISQWMLDTLPADLDQTIPTWRAFQQRIVTHFQNVTAKPQSIRYHLCFTSAGIITALVSHYLRLNPIQSLALLMKIKNSSTTELKIESHSNVPKVYLNQLNNTEHLVPNEITFY